MADDRRILDRISIGCRVLLTPIEQDGSLMIEDNVAFLGQDVSPGGICFSHDRPLPRDHFLLSFRDTEVGGVVVEAEVAWTQPIAAGHYKTGCRIVRQLIVPPSLAEPSLATIDA